ncbi:STAS domain-containing protein [Tepidimonas charontis]|uniref:STAS domain protein n=1 Tax=Tepidimonas charontis TaxID=2267262 RepID=A0A554XJI5_9BURK|nr:STAS domain-containing protein [Tepidimonas charontis]TSE35990.1 STAS domain protein [Tepidimonas charontis]
MATTVLPPLPATLTQAEAEGYLARCRAAIAGAAAGAPWRLDASALQTFDSSALAVLLALRREAAARGAPWQLDGMPQRLQVLAGLYGVAELIAA